MLNRFTYYSFIAIAFLFVSSCTSFQESNPVEEIISADILLDKKIPNQWKISGKVAIIGEEDNWFASYIWNKNPEGMQLLFSGPLGETYLILQQSKHELGEINKLTMGKEVYTDKSLSSLINQQLRFDIPIESLKYWLFGQINPNQTYTIKKISENEKLTAIQQEKWNISFSYENHIDEYPYKIIALNDEFKIKFFIRLRENR